MTERWLPVPGFEGFYEVSDRGRVRSLARRVRTAQATRRHGGGIMTPMPDKDGYPKVMFRVGGRHVTRRVHRLVCEAFNGPPNILHTEVHHIDRDRANAKADNLRWVSHSENLCLRANDGGTAGESNGFARLKEADVLQILSSPNEAAKKLAVRFGVTHHTIYDIRLGRSWRHLSSKA